MRMELQSVSVRLDGKNYSYLEVTFFLNRNMLQIFLSGLDLLITRL